MDEALSVREFWFGRGRMSAQRLTEQMRLWFGGADAAEERERRDEEVRSRFGELFERAAQGELDSWADGPRRRLSLIILLDQFPRHLFRATARAFATDDKALGLTLSGMQSAADAALEAPERLFFYMPLQHAERLEVQEESVVACRRLLLEAPQSMRATFESTLESARQHRDIIARFGRFPHRNVALGRESTTAEQEWLKSESETFSQ
jgi:uncharacterized protein (DUF924 family)